MSDVPFIILFETESFSLLSPTLVVEDLTFLPFAGIHRMASQIQPYIVTCDECPLVYGRETSQDLCSNLEEAIFYREFYLLPRKNIVMEGQP